MSSEAPTPDGPIVPASLGARPLSGADPTDLAEALTFALRYDKRRRVHTADEMMARITADRLIEHLERSGFVVMKKAMKPEGPDRHYAPSVPGRE